MSGAESSRVGIIEAFFGRSSSSTLDATLRKRLVDKYRRFEPHPCAAEIGAWMRGGNEFDPAYLTE